MLGGVTPQLCAAQGDVQTAAESASAAVSAAHAVPRCGAGTTYMSDGSGQGH